MSEPAIDKKTVATVVGARPEVEVLMHDGDQYARRRQLGNPHGDGNSAGRIREVLERDPA